MAYTIYIKGSNKTSLLRAGTLKISKGSDNRSECYLTLISTSSYSEIIGRDLQVKDGATIIFGGIIKTVDITQLEPGVGTSQKLQLDIMSNGYNDIAARRTINGFYNASFAGEIVTHLIGDILSASGADDHILRGTVDNGSFYARYVADFKSVKEILDDLAESSGFKWYIDDERYLNFLAEDAIINAPYDIEEEGSFTDFNIVSVSASLENYRNKQFVVGAQDTDGTTIFATVLDADEITNRQALEGSAYSSGIYGNVITDSNIESLADATIVAENALKRYGASPSEITFTSYTNEWKAGSKLKVNLPTFGINDDTYYLIESVEIDDLDGTNLMSTITATSRKSSDFSTQRSENYFDYFAKLISSSGTSIAAYDLQSISFYANGFSAVYSGSVISFRWVKNIDGLITSLISDDDITIPITWSEGDM